MISNCDICFTSMRSKSQVEEVEKSNPSTSLMDRFMCDLFQWESKQYLVGVCEYSGMFWLQWFTHTPTTDIDGVSPSRIFYQRELRNPELPFLDDSINEEMLGKERQVRKEEARVKRNSKVSKFLERYSPAVGDLVFLQDQKSHRWDIPATVSASQREWQICILHHRGQCSLPKESLVHMQKTGCQVTAQH